MTQLYTSKKQREILVSLGIKAKDGKLTGEESARILTWRAKEERGIDHQYTPSILRRHVEQGNLAAYPGTRGKSRKNLYDVEAVFELSIEPRRGLRQRAKGTL
jgi:hypothetical protein